MKTICYFAGLRRSSANLAPTGAFSFNFQFSGKLGSRSAKAGLAPINPKSFLLFKPKHIAQGAAQENVGVLAV